MCFILENNSKIQKLSVVRKEPETIVFQALGIIESKTVWGAVLA